MLVAERYVQEGCGASEILGRLCRDYPEVLPLDLQSIRALRRKMGSSPDGTNGGRMTIWHLRPDVTQFAGALVPYLSASKISREISGPIFIGRDLFRGHLSKKRDH